MKHKLWEKTLGKVFPDSTRTPWIVIICVTLATLFVGVLFESIPMFNGEIFSDAFSSALKSANNSTRRAAFVSYHIFLYLTVALYASSAVYILARKHSVNWCTVVIGFSIIYLLFCNVYLTLMVKVDDMGLEMYKMYVTSFTSVISIMTAVSGVKMGRIYDKDQGNS